jgi:putative endonuclease
MWLKKLAQTLTIIDRQAAIPLDSQQQILNQEKIKEKTVKKKIGDWAETTAKHHLEKHGLKLETCNYNCSLGEIDLILTDKDQLVFVEVRFRKSSSHGSALESVGLSKQKKVIKAAQYYLQEKRLTDKISCRFDVIGIQKDNNGNPNIQWIKNAFY